MSTKKVILIILDSLGVGALPDAHLFGDDGVNTLQHIAESVDSINIPSLEAMGIGNLVDSPKIKKTDNAIGYYGMAGEESKAKDTSSGHWEIAGLVSKVPFNTYPNGFPKETLDAIEAFSGRKIVCNKPYSGTELLDDYGDEQMEKGTLIVYTSADSVLQIAAHEDIIPVDELYRICEESLEICNKYSPVARVIARPYLGTGKGNFKRTERRHDYSIEPPLPTMLDRLLKNNIDTIGIGKTSDIFAGRGIKYNKLSNKNNLDGILKTLDAMKEYNSGLIFTNLVDFDMLFGHRRDALGYKNALEEFDSYLPKIIDSLNDDDLLIITADHGCDPTFKGTDHTREYIPILAYGKNLKKNVNIGTRKSFTCIASSIETFLLGKSDLPDCFL